LKTVKKKRTYSEFAERDKYKNVRWFVRNSVHHRFVEYLDKIRLFIYVFMFTNLQLSLLHLSDLNAKLEAFVKAPALLFDNSLRNGIKNF
jgi:hypothetical protein